MQRLLGVERELLSVEGEGAEAPADWDNLRTPETYLGYGRGGSGGTAPLSDLLLNDWALAGEWTIGPENIVLDRAGGSIAFRFHSRDAHLVMSPGRHEPIPFHVLLDGEPPGASHGVTRTRTGPACSTTGRMYQLVRQQDGISDRTLEIIVRRPGRGGVLVHLRVALGTVSGRCGSPPGTSTRVKQRVPRLLPWLDERRPDVVCLQETKLADDAFAELLGDELPTAATRSPRTARRPGTAWRSSRASGSTTWSPGSRARPASRIRRRARSPRRAAAIRVVSVYVPNGREPGSDHYGTSSSGWRSLRDVVAAGAGGDASCAAT